MKNKVLLVLVVVIIAGISFWYMRKSQVGEVSAPLQEVSLKLNWKHEAEFAGNYIAVEKGLYKKEGLRVNISEFVYGGDNSIDAVASGKSDFGVAGADEIIKARVSGKPIKAIAVIYKINPVVAFSLKSSGITKPQDFIGKTVGLERGINVDYLYAAMMGKLGIDRKKIKEVDIGYDAKELMEGKVDVSTGWITNEPNLVTAAGYEVNTILMADYGVNIYADTLITSDKMIAEKPEVVEKFVKATLSGWQYAFEHESEAVDITMKYAKNSNRSQEAYVLSKSIPLINTGITRLGWMEKSAWDQAQNILFDQKLITKKINTEDAYTMRFLNSIYNQK